MKYIILIPLILLLTACPATEKYRAEQQAAIADQMAQQARMVEAETQAQMMQTLADAARPTYWPIIVVVALFVGVLVLFMYWHMRAIETVMSNGGGSQIIIEKQPIMLSQMSFKQLRAEARREGYELEVEGASYYLVDNSGNRQRIKGLIGANHE